MIAGDAVEIVVALLLVATCAYCYLLNRRLKALKDGQDDLKTAIATFDQATRRAQENLERMESNSVAMGRDLAGVMGRANAVVSELSVMVSAGDHIAGRIETAVNDVRAIGKRAGGLQ